MFRGERSSEMHPRMDIQLSLSHLGYLPESPKILTLLPGDASGLPDAIPFYLRQNCLRMPRSVKPEEVFRRAFLPRTTCCEANLFRVQELPLFYQGELRRISSRWGCHVAGRFQPLPYSRQLSDRN